MIWKFFFVFDVVWYNLYFVCGIILIICVDLVGVKLCMMVEFLGDFGLLIVVDIVWFCFVVCCIMLLKYGFGRWICFYLGDGIIFLLLLLNGGSKLCLVSVGDDCFDDEDIGDGISNSEIFNEVVWCVWIGLK